MDIDWIMRRMRHVGLALVLPVALGTPLARADVLDGIVFGVKCLGAADRKACEEQSKREADEMRNRLRQRPAALDQEQRAGSTEEEESAGEKVHRNWTVNVVCRQFTKRSPRDVDTNYARAMTHYSFMTAREAKALPGFGEGVLYAAGYSHEATPGALYRLEQVVHSPDVAGGKRQYKLILNLARDGSGTRVTGQYCVTTDDPAGWQDLPPQVLSSLNNTF